MVRDYRIDASLVDCGVFFDWKSGVSCAGRKYQLLFD